MSLNQSGDLFYKAYRVDLFSQTFKCLISLGLFLVIVLGQKFKSIEERLQPEFFMFLCLSALGLMLMVSSVELLTIFIAMELSSYSLYVLIPIRNQVGGKQMEAAIKYIIFGAAATGVMLFGMSYIFGVSQSTYLVDILQKMPLLIKNPSPLSGFFWFSADFSLNWPLFLFISGPRMFTRERPMKPSLLWPPCRNWGPWPCCFGWSVWPGAVLSI